MKSADCLGNPNIYLRLPKRTGQPGQPEIAKTAQSKKKPLELHTFAVTKPLLADFASVLTLKLNYLCIYYVF